MIYYIKNIFNVHNFIKKIYSQRIKIFFKFRANLNSIIHYESINYFLSNDSLMNKIRLLLLCQNKF